LRPEGQFTTHHLSRILIQVAYKMTRELLYAQLSLAGVEDVRVGLVKSGRIAMSAFSPVNPRAT
jgi:hypothetical protein